MDRKGIKKLLNRWQEKIDDLVSGFSRERQRDQRRWPLLTFLPLILIGAALWWLVRQPEEQDVMEDESDKQGRYRPAKRGRSDRAGQAQAENLYSEEPQRFLSKETSQAFSPVEETLTEMAGEDDLVEIEGIGPKTAGVLREAGIQTFAQLAAADVEHLKEIVRNANLLSADPGTWPEQASLAAKGDWEALYALREELQAGRRL